MLRTVDLTTLVVAVFEDDDTQGKSTAVYRIVCDMPLGWNSRFFPCFLQADWFVFFRTSGGGKKKHVQKERVEI